MRQFQFRLERALKFALLRENQKKTQIAAALQRMRFLDRYLTRVEGEIQKALRESNQAVGTLSAEAHRMVVVPKIDEHKRLKKLLEEEGIALHKTQEELKRLSQRRRSLESLKEKKFQEFRMERSRAEQKSVDEMAGLSRAVRGNSKT